MKLLLSFNHMFPLFTCAALIAQGVAAQERFVWQPQLQVVLAEHFAASEEAAPIVTNLVELLTRITGVEVQAAFVSNATDARGIVLALAADFPEQGSELISTDSMRREDYRLVSSGTNVRIIGSTAAGVKNGVADLMYRMGYRCYFPMPEWEILPSVDELNVAVDVIERPAYIFRDFFLTSPLPGDMDAYDLWRFWNRQGSSFVLNTRHSYNAIYNRNRAVFDANEDFFAVYRNKTSAATQKKFNAANPQLLALLVEDGKQQFAGNPDFDSISMEPSDGAGWDDSGEAFNTIGKPSNQAVTMANAVAKGAAAPLGKYVGMYAYHHHQDAPDIEVEPNLIVSFATRFMRPDRDLIESIQEWQAQGLQNFGIRDYASWWEADNALPGRGQGGDINYLKQSIKTYHEMGARFYTSEFAGAWGPYGLGVYTGTHLLWNPEADTDAIVEDFLQKSFGPAADVMRRFYGMLNGEDSVMARQVTYPAYYAVLLEAVDAAQGQEPVLKRLQSLLAYVRYLELFTEFGRAPTKDKQAALDTAREWTLLIDRFHMLSTYGALMCSRNVSFSGMSGMGGLKHPSRDVLMEQLEMLSTQPVTMDELLIFAFEALENEQPQELPRLPVVDKRTVSPLVRNGGAFVFPMNAGEEVSAELEFRRYGFSWLPRYGVIGPDGQLQSVSQMESAKQSIAIHADAPGNYILVMDASPNLVRLESPRSFYLLPSADLRTLEFVRFTGALSLNVPTGGTPQLVAGGQGRTERMNFSLLAADGTELISEMNVNGIEPVVFDLSGGESAEGAAYTLRLSPPSGDYFEDQFIRLQGQDGHGLPFGLSENK